MAGEMNAVDIWRKMINNWFQTNKLMDIKGIIYVVKKENRLLNSQVKILKHKMKVTKAYL